MAVRRAGVRGVGINEFERLATTREKLRSSGLLGRKPQRFLALGNKRTRRRRERTRRDSPAAERDGADGRVGEERRTAGVPVPER